VNSILLQQGPEWELVVCTQGDDPSLKQEVERLRAVDPRIRFIHLDKMGKSLAINTTMAAARGDVLAFTDDDCEAAPDWLAVIARCFEERPDVGIVAGDLIAPPAARLRPSTCPATSTIECVYRPSEHDFKGPPGFYWGGGNFAIRRSALDRVGPFDVNLGPGTEFPSSEDIDFALRAELLDVVMWTTPRSKIHHTYGRRSGISSVLAHHRGYAIGSGALIAKLDLAGHRLGREWGPPYWGHSQTMLGHLRLFARSPGRALRELYRVPHTSRSYYKFMEEYELAPGGLSRRKPTAVSRTS
jgi:GT2 family glycosyltransferase